MKTEIEQNNQSSNLQTIDYKDILQLKNHINPHSRMYNRKRTNFSAKQQRGFAKAIKRARIMALLPFVSH